MGMTKYVIRAAILLAFSTPMILAIHAAPVSAGVFGSDRNKTRKEFTQLWNQRETTYRSQFVVLDAANKLAAEALLSRSFDFAPGDDRFAVWARATIAANAMSGRGATLAHFLTHIATKPSSGLTRAWLQEQLDFMLTKQAEAQAASTAVDELVASKATTRRQFLLASEAAAMKRGEVLGTSEELSLLIENYRAYADEFAQAEGRDADNSRRRAAMFGAIANSMRTQPAWTATCNRFGTMVTCSGN